MRVKCELCPWSAWNQGRKIKDVQNPHNERKAVIHTMTQVQNAVLLKGTGPLTNCWTEESPGAERMAVT